MPALAVKVDTHKPDLAIPYKLLIKNVLMIQLILINVSAVVIYKNVLLLCKEWVQLAEVSIRAVSVLRNIRFVIAVKRQVHHLVLGTG